MDQYSQAIQHYNSSIKVIETRLGEALSGDKLSFSDLENATSPKLNQSKESCSVVFTPCMSLAMLQEVMATAEEEAAAEDNSEMEELKQLLPDIRERIEDAKESQKTASTASQAIQQTLVSLQTGQEH